MDKIKSWSPQLVLSAYSNGVLKLSVHQDQAKVEMKFTGLEHPDAGKLNQIERSFL